MSNPEPEVKPSWTEPDIVEWVKNMRAPTPLTAAHLGAGELVRHPTELIAERADAIFIPVGHGGSGGAKRQRRFPWVRIVLVPIGWAFVWTAIAFGIALGFLAIWS